jgi:hypothetical protein
LKKLGAFLTSLTLILLAVGISLSISSADSPHLIRASAKLVGDTPTITAKYAGLGSEQTYQVAFNGTGSVNWTCTNRGTHVVEPHSGSASFGGSVSATTTKSGTLTVTLPLTINPGLSCPSRQWILDVTSVSGSGALTLTGGGLSISDPFSFSLP